MTHHVLASEDMKEAAWLKTTNLPMKHQNGIGMIWEFLRQTLGNIFKLTINQLFHLKLLILTGKNFKLSLKYNPICLSI